MYEVNKQSNASFSELLLRFREKVQIRLILKDTKLSTLIVSILQLILLKNVLAFKDRKTHIYCIYLRFKVY